MIIRIPGLKNFGQWAEIEYTQDFKFEQFKKFIRISNKHIQRCFIDYHIYDVYGGEYWDCDYPEEFFTIINNAKFQEKFLENI